MDFNTRNFSFQDQRPKSSYTRNIKSVGVITRNYFTKDSYKQKLLSERKADLSLKIKHRKSIEKRSARRFLYSPFAINILADTEIQEHERNLAKRNRKSKSGLKNLKKKNNYYGYLNKLREEIRKIHDGT
jgi:hypothetical protein